MAAKHGTEKITDDGRSPLTDVALCSRRWDAEYRRGRYLEEEPLAFVSEILAILDQDPVRRGGLGLYVGCGNGRNYLPLVDAGLCLYGLDLSPEALRQLASRRPALPLVCGDFRTSPIRHLLDYVVAIQVLQHGTNQDVAPYFAHVAACLRAGGLFFLRVNSTSTQVLHAHTILERDVDGGTTIRYDAGPKRGLAVHFYGREELTALTEDAFDVVVPLREQLMHRSPPALGSWAQWEAIWRRR